MAPSVKKPVNPPKGTPWCLDPHAPAWWEDACAHLAQLDARWAELMRRHNDRSLRSRGDPYQTLVRAIVGQQISVKAADAVFGRVLAVLGGTVAPQRVLQTGRDTLRNAGLSERKVEYLRSLAEFAGAGGLQSDRLDAMDDEQCIAHLVQVKGIGRWTAEMFLIFNLMRPDVWPLDDIGLLRALGEMFEGGKSPDRRRAGTMGEALRPYRTVATWYLWRSLDPIAVDY